MITKAQTEAQWIAEILEHGPKSWVVSRSYNYDGFDPWELPRAVFITRAEAFRRWKIARKAWETRKAKQQELPL